MRPAERAWGLEQRPGRTPCVKLIWVSLGLWKPWLPPRLHAPTWKICFYLLLLPLVLTPLPLIYIPGSGPTEEPNSNFSLLSLELDSLVSVPIN